MSIVSLDMSLSENDIIRIYGHRGGVCQDKCVSFFAIRKAVRKGRLFYGKKLKIARTLAFFPEFFHQ